MERDQEQQDKVGNITLWVVNNLRQDPRRLESVGNLFNRSFLREKYNKLAIRVIWQKYITTCFYRI